MFCLRNWLFLCIGCGCLLSADEWNRVYLVSFPRSGNHWIRFLVEEATHITTSSVYRDPDFPHLPTVFPWGGYVVDQGYKGNCRLPTTNDPILIKTHYPFLPQKGRLREIDPNQDNIICLIRHPVDSLYSFYVYRNKLRNADLISWYFVEKFVSQWKLFYEFWGGKPNVTMIRYEDILADPEKQLSKILQIAGFSFEEEDIKRAVAANPPIEEALKHRIHYKKKWEKFVLYELQDLLFKYKYVD